MSVDQSGANVGAPAPFAVTGPPSVALTAGRTGETTYTVTNLTGRPVKARFRARGAGGALDPWFHLTGPAELSMVAAGTATVTVRLAVPPAVAEGSYALLLEVVAEDDTEAVTGQVTSFAVPAPVALPRPFPWLMIAVIAAVVLVLGGGALWLIFGRDEPQPPLGPASAPTSSASPVPSPLPNNDCIEGYVWRLVIADDRVCVLPSVAADVVADNAVRESRWVNGVYGPHTCLNGYVWREAYVGDDVCVTGDRRQQAFDDNLAAASRRRP